MKSRRHLWEFIYNFVTSCFEEEEDEGHIYGSALNPASLRGAADKKEIAKPNAKVEVKTFNRDVNGGAPADAIAKAKEAMKKAQPKN